MKRYPPTSLAGGYLSFQALRRHPTLLSHFLQNIGCGNIREAAFGRRKLFIGAELEELDRQGEVKLPVFALPS